MKEYKHVIFHVERELKIKLTRKWRVWGNGFELGEVKWWAHWRRYCFFPARSMVFDADCMWDIADFCSRMTKEQKEDQKKRRAAKHDIQR